MAAKKYMTSYYVLYACFAIIVLFFAAFFGYGYDNPVGDYNAPVCTEGFNVADVRYVCRNLLVGALECRSRH